ncbi:MAG: MBL fold metallo-hydrolase [Gemmatimonadetes bacterium]|nr:MBL fold metallo-hydrolase [Gemmatimonadota bacterium]
MTSAGRVPEITPEELIREIETGGAIQVLDVRAPHRLESGYIDLLPEDRFFNMAGSKIVALDDVAELGIAKDRPVAVVCGHGNSSKNITTFLEERGYLARSVRGGMAAWMNSAYPRPLPAPTGFDHLIQYDRVGKGSLAYLLISDGKALVIDPARNWQIYVDAAADLDAKIVAVADTHVHADYISGASDMAKSLKITYYMHPEDNSHVYEGTPGKLDITPVDDGMQIEIGRGAIAAFHTPGHTLGSTTFLVSETAAFSGDFLFVKSIGRPDLGGQVDPWSAILWKSVVRAKETLPADIMIYPAHYSSDSERQDDRSIGATFEAICQSTAPLRIQTEEEFTGWVKSHVSSFPEAYRKIKVINVGLLEVTPEEAEELEVGKSECAVA